ncbi:MAG: hypothetical protein NHF94_00725 [Candidatus Bostrichicola ureolyticus]|nr:MAG: hypothetical protein NHF94_00725 [Candidatus Bostrichicola ureolyticus]
MHFKKNNIISLGCYKNIYDSEILMVELISRNKLFNNTINYNIVIINTCGFT